MRRRCVVGEDRRAEVTRLRPAIGRNPLEVVELGHRRVEADLESFDLAEQRALEKAGFVREGVLRSAVWRGGQWHDSVLCSMLRAERPGGVPM
ncbi:GNAT family N-acetyltransferase [Streptomyces sp. NPDC014724]|uniref:GNAT family N-acetyltransferase n=1 Tax=unclassified Streptomyces TaxID=2593676 RepID=UPI00370112EE